DKIQFVIMRHEASGAFAASAQAKLTGNLGVCVACQGPGAVNLLNGLYDAALDKVPVLAITGQVSSDLIGTGMPQEINQLNLFNDVAIFNQEVRSAQNFPQLLMLACQAAINHKGVAHLSIPSDMMRQKAIKLDPRYHILKFNSKLIPSDEELDEAASILNNANNVSILYGGGSFCAKDELLEISNKLKAPLVHTTRSKDILDNKSANYVGGIGIMGCHAGNQAVSECDALLVVGSSFAFKEFYPNKADIIQIDSHIEKIGAHVAITQGLLGDSKLTLQALMPRLNIKTDDNFLRKAQSMKIKAGSHLEYFAKPTEEGQFIHPQALTERIGELADEDAIFCVGTGSVTVYCNNYLHLNGKQRLLWTWNLASLGWALAASLGCKLAQPHRQVIVPVGDGDFQMLIADLITFVKYGLPVVFVVYNNSKYRFIELEEYAEGNPSFGTDLLNPDYAKLAIAHGAFGVSVTSYAQIDSALKDAFSCQKPAVIDVAVNPQELFVPPKITPKMAFSFAKGQVREWRFFKSIMNFIHSHIGVRH
ncbi:MAG: thiamine pyrophosphate-binding protein, partial [Candidatus Berkiella sp.]